MSDRPWLKFYPQDWMGEPRLRACSLAARGLWMEMIALAHQATPYGHVLVNGNAPDIATLSRMVGVSESECEALVAELESNGVFSRTRKGVIYSRRMVKDAKKAAHARNIGQRGGNPSLTNKSKNQPQDNPKTNGQDKPQRPEARGQKENARGADDQSIEAEFEVWYAAYPRHVAKGQALKAYRAARKKTDAKTLLDGIERYRRIKPDYADWAHPATWLNGERWLDEDSPGGSSGRDQYDVLLGNLN